MKRLRPKRLGVKDLGASREDLKESRIKSTASEKQIENSILQWLSYQPRCKAWKNQSVGIYDPVRKSYRKPASKFTAKGSSDIIGIWNGRMICIEVKSAKGRLTPEQNEFLKAMSALGAFCLVAKDLQTVIDAFAGEIGNHNSGQTGLC
jgi:penicillin-binding protein-related factor A (putative recombinase)